MEQLNENELEEVSGGSWKNEWFEYTVVYGDSLSALALRFGTNINKILMLNPEITNPDLIHAGQKIKIPTPQNKKGWI